jgi:hypothetical protein
LAACGWIVKPMTVSRPDDVNGLRWQEWGEQRLLFFYVFSVLELLQYVNFESMEFIYFIRSIVPRYKTKTKTKTKTFAVRSDKEDNGEGP